jgi:dTDP-4-dehydrorhamnose 3,5-epimerase
MIYIELAVAGAFEIGIEPIRDPRGFFARVWDVEDLEARGLIGAMRQANTGVSPTPGTFRGLHLQRDPHAEAKLVRCTAGRAFDVVVDLRPGSPTLGRWAGVELSAEARNMVYAPPGTAHGYLTLEPDTEVGYMTSEAYAPQAAYGVRYDDPAFAIKLPMPVAVISQADRSWPDARI